MLELIIIGLYFLAVAIIGVTSHRRHWKLDDFLVAGRKYSSFFITGSLLATIIGGSATVGLAGLGFSRGLTGAWWLLVGCVGLIVLGLFFAKKIREFGGYTLPGLITKQYDRRVGFTASILIVLAWVGVTAGQILAAGKILSATGIGSPELWMVIFTVIFVGYTLIGGQYAIIRTDVLDIVIIFIGIFTGLGVILWKLGGLDGLWQALPADKLAFPFSNKFGGVELASYLLLVGLPYVVGPDMYSRLFCAKDGRTAKLSVFWAALLLVPLALGITLIGMGAFALHPDIAAEQAFPALISGGLPVLAAGIILAALVSAIMSTADATLLSASTILSVDIIGYFRKSKETENTLKFSRWGIPIIGVVALGLAFMLNGVITALLFAYTIFTCGVILPVIAGFYRKRLKITSTAAITAIIGGGAISLFNKLLGIVGQNAGEWVSNFINNQIWMNFSGLIASLALLFIVSWVENFLKSRRSVPDTISGK